ncbi:MAG TPA: hypothetical protein PKZ27_03750 [Rhodocyclaceae bacterium]|nr:hypothetical protein [Rhodocyclaceae bacterium]
MKRQSRNSVNKMFGLMLACVAMAACGNKEAATPTPDQSSAQSTATAAQAPDATPANVILWSPPGKTAPADFAQRLRALQDDGAASDVRVVKEYAHEVKEGYGPGFDELAIVQFPNESAYEQWKTSPASDFGPDVITSRVDITTDRRSRKNNPSQSIYVVSQYETFVSPEEYRIYSEDYINPNMDNQYHSGIMTRYTMYLEREATGGLEHPRAFLVTEYANQSEFDRKASVKDPYKALLLSGTHPEWARLNTEKKKMRRDFTESYAKPAP